MESGYSYKYKVEYDNDEITNVIIYEIDETHECIEFMAAQNEIEFEYDLDGVYITEDYYSKIEFTEGENLITFKYYQVNNGNPYSTYTYDYIKFDGKYYMNNYLFDISEDLSTIEYSGKKYTKQEEVVPEKYYMLGSGDVITGYKAGNYTSSNPYVLSLDGCSGSFAEQDFEWVITSISKENITMKANGVTTDQLTLTGANGWNNSLTALKDVCTAVYGGSTSKYTSTARNINPSEAGVKETVTSNTYSASVYGNNNKFPTSYLAEQGVANITEDSNGCGYATNSNITVANTSFIDVSQTYIGRFSSPYWLSRRCVVAKNNTSASFSVGWVTNSSTNSPPEEATLFDSSGTETTQTKSVRPVVTLTISDWSCLNTTDGTSWTITNE